MEPHLFGQRVKARRIELKLTQAELGELVGVSQVSIKKIEAGGNTRHGRKIAEALKTSLELLVDETRKMVFSIVSLAFKEDNKWRLHDGNSIISATITDDDFQHKVDTNQANFAKGDVLVCDVRVKQWQSKAGAKTEYEVVRVIEHRTAARQIPLPSL